MSNEPWNDWHGLTMGDMLEELVEYDTVCFGIPADEARASLERYEDEHIRKAWWYAIGRHDR